MASRSGTFPDRKVLTVDVLWEVLQFVEFEPVFGEKCGNNRYH